MRQLHAFVHIWTLAPLFVGSVVVGWAAAGSVGVVVGIAACSLVLMLAAWSADGQRKRALESGAHPRPDVAALSRLEWRATWATTLGMAVVETLLVVFTHLPLGLIVLLTVLPMMVITTRTGNSMAHRMQGATRDDWNDLFDLEFVRHWRPFMFLGLGMVVFFLGILAFLIVLAARGA